MQTRNKKGIIYAVRWRVTFLLKNMWGKTPYIIFYTLFPFVRHRKHARERFLERHGYIVWDRGKRIVHTEEMHFFYPNKVPTGNIISIILGNIPFVRRNFIDNIGLYQEGPYERSGAVLEMGDYVIDAGANIGIFSVLAGKKVGSEGCVYACEPIADARTALMENAKVNNLSNITLIPKALGASEEALTFSIDPSALGSSTAKLTNPNATETYSVPQTTLDTLVANGVVDRVDFIKADIEGMERELLAGAKEAIRRFTPKIAICTYHLPDDPQVLEDLIRSYVPEYTIVHSPTKLYAWIER